MTDTFLPNPEDYYRPSRVGILGTLQAVTTNRHLQVVTNQAAISGYSAQIPIDVHEVSQSIRYWEFMQTPQLIPPGPSGGVCPCPTRLPPEPNARGPLETVSTESCGYPLPTVFSQHKQLPVTSCDHTSCDPPPDVGFLSRRFTENGIWIRARALAAASLAYRRRGCKSL